MLWKDLGAKLRSGGLQALGAALAGPGGAAAGALLAERLGAAEADPEVVVQAIEADPASADILTDLDVEMEKQRRETMVVAAGISKEEMAVQEANIREARLSPDMNPTRERMAYITLGVLVVSLAALVGVEVIWDVPDMVLGLAVGIIGGFATNYQSMTSFFFGTSSGSAAKERAAAVERIIDKSKE